MEQNEKETIGVKNEENVESTPQTTQKSHEETAKKLKAASGQPLAAAVLRAIILNRLWSNITAGRPRLPL